jgi:hypothetical protein
MSSFHVAPQQGHLDCLKRMYGYIKRNPTGATCFQVRIPNHDQISNPIQCDWSSSIYGNVTEELPPDMPTPRGTHMRNSTYQDANLPPDLVTDRAMSGIIHLVNQTPIASYFKYKRK